MNKPHIFRMAPNWWLCRIPGKFWWGGGSTCVEAYEDWVKGKHT